MSTSPLHPYAGRFEVHDALPETGVPRERILDELRQMSSEEDAKGDSGRVSGSIYSGDHDHYRFLTEAYGFYAHSNVLQRDMYPSATKMEAEIIAMTADMLHGHASNGRFERAGHDPVDDVGGLVTSGGTESLVTAMLTYREWGRHTKGIERPQIIMPVTAHPGHDKGMHYFGIDVVKAPVTDEFVVDVDFVREHIGPSTVALVGSAGTYPHGLIDPIPELGQLAIEHDIGLHVDGCLGGFVIPWAEDLGYPLPPFDFRVPGVTSISADTHKYGYALKGSSVLLFRPKALRRHQYLVVDGWPGGNYASPSMGGSRSGGLIAATWASMLHLGRAGYRAIAADIFRTADSIKAAVRSHPELTLIGDSLFNVAFRATPGADAVDIYHVNDGLADRGWRMNALQNPPALHFCVTRPNTQPGIAEAFATDLAAAVEYAHHPAAPMPRSGAVYGAGGQLPPERTALHATIADRLDSLHEVGPKA
ncbi:MAG: Sphingosine-phosphate lyase (SP-lyase) [Ilumatobacteraceae bacterium]|nr:Sphingosine-phosphate lyase (SP-lyase) [Ilumatobacteraceae bacterium]